MGAVWSSLGQVAASLVELQLRALEAGSAPAVGREQRPGQSIASDRKDSFVSASGQLEASSKDEPSRRAAARCRQGECARGGASSQAGGASRARPNGYSAAAATGASRRPARRNVISSERERDSANSDKTRANEMQATIVFVAQSEPLAHVTPSAVSPLLYEDSSRLASVSDSCELFCEHHALQTSTEPMGERRRRDLASERKQLERQSRARAELNLQAPPLPVARNHRINLAQSTQQQASGGADGGRDNWRHQCDKMAPATAPSEAVGHHRYDQAGRARDAAATGGDESAPLAAISGQRESRTALDTSSLALAGKTQPRPRLLPPPPPGLTATTNAQATQAAQTMPRANKRCNQAELIQPHQPEPRYNNLHHNLQHNLHHNLHHNPHHNIQYNQVIAASNMKQNTRYKQTSPTFPNQNSSASTTREHRSLSTCSTMTTASTHSLGHSSTSSGFSSPVINDDLKSATCKSTAGKSKRLMRRHHQLAAANWRSSSCSWSSSSSVGSTDSSITSLGDETNAENTAVDLLHPAVSALFLSSANLHHQPEQAERGKPKRSKHQKMAGAVGRPIKLLNTNMLPKFAREPRIQDSTYFEAPSALDHTQTIQLQLTGAEGPSSEPPPRPWLEPNNPLAKRSSLAGPIDGRARSLRSLGSALGRHHSIGELNFTHSSGVSRQSSSASSTSSNQEQLQQNRLDPIASDEFTALSYNVLSDRLVNTERFPSSPDIALNWLYRRELILRQLGEYNADLIALQELEMEQFCDYFEPELRKPAHDYVGLFESKSRARTMDPQMRKRVDGCALFYKRARFRLIGQHLLEFNRLALANSRGSEAMINRVSTRDNIAMVAVLELIEPQLSHSQEAQVLSAGIARSLEQDNEARPNRLIVCNTHIHWDPEFRDVKLVQTIMLMNELKTIAANYSQAQPSAEMPLVLLGDFNSLPKSGVTSYLLGGHISSLHEDFQSFRYTKCDNSLVMEAVQSDQENRPPQARVERRPALIRTASSRTDVKPAQLASSRPLERRRDSLPLISSNTIISNSPSGLPNASLISPIMSTSSNASFAYHSNSSISSPKYAANLESPTIIDYAHPFKLKSAYELGTMPFTNYTTKFKATIDYIFYSQDSLSLLGLLGPLDKRWLRGHKIRGFPQLHFPSDHLPLLVKFKLINSVSAKQQAVAATVAHAQAVEAKCNNHPARKQSLVAENLTLKQNIKKSNKKQKYAPRKDRDNDLAVFNHKKTDHQHATNGSGSSTPDQQQNQQTPFLGTTSRPYKQQRTFWPKKLVAGAGQQPDELSERIKFNERWSQ